MPDPNKTCPVCKELAEALEEAIEILLGTFPETEFTYKAKSILTNHRKSRGK